jgi:hypothetical protein
VQERLRIPKLPSIFLPVINIHNQVYSVNTFFALFNWKSMFLTDA